MKHYLILWVLIGWFGAEAKASDYEGVCRDRYRVAIEKMLDAVEAFNQGDLERSQFLAYFSSVETEIGAKRAACVLESDQTSVCVLKYKAQYKKIRDQIDMLAIARGQQTEVHPGALLIEGKMALIDLQCQ